MEKISSSLGGRALQKLRSERNMLQGNSQMVQKAGRSCKHFDLYLEVSEINGHYNDHYEFFFHERQLASECI